MPRVRRDEEGAPLLRAVVARNVRGARTARDLTQDDLARRMNALGHETWSRGSVSELERAMRSLNVEELLSVCKALGVTPPELFDATVIDGFAGTHLRVDTHIAGADLRAFFAGELRVRVHFDQDGNVAGSTTTVRRTPQRDAS